MGIPISLLNLHDVGGTPNSPCIFARTNAIEMADFRGPASESQRVMQLQKRRERAQEEIEFKRKKLADDLKLDKMEQKFSARYDAVETNLKSATVGLVTNEEMKKRQEEAVMAHEMALARKSKDE